MRKHLKYLQYVIRHKWFVFRAGLVVGVPIWQLIIHDWSKFTPSEWFPYVDYFYSISKTPELEDAFDRAWLHHQHANPHHWQHWLLRQDNPSSGKGKWRVQSHSPETGPWELALGGQPVGCFADRNDPMHNASYAIVNDIAKGMNTAPIALKMPERYAREMVADWIGAGLAMGKPDIAGWYKDNKKNITLHPETLNLIEEMMIKYLNWRQGESNNIDWFYAERQRRTGQRAWFGRKQPW